MLAKFIILIAKSRELMPIPVIKFRKQTLRLSLFISGVYLAIIIIIIANIPRFNKAELDFRRFNSSKTLYIIILLMPRVEISINTYFLGSYTYRITTI